MTTRRLLLLIPGLFWASCASGPAPAPEAQVAAVKPDQADLDFDATLRRIAARARRGEAVYVRQEYAAKVAQEPANVPWKLFLAWADAPSESSWEEINQVSKVFPDEVWARVLLGRIYLQWKGFIDQADGEFDRVLKVKPQLVPARIGKADVLRARGKYAEAKAAYEAVLAASPDWQEAWLGLGLAQAALKDPAARTSLNRALALDGDDLVVVSALAKLSMESHDVEAAIASYRMLSKVNPRDRELHLSLARLYEEKKDLASATAEYEQAQALGGDLAVLHKLIALYREQKRSEDESRMLEKLGALDATDPSPWLRIAELRRADGDTEAAEAALRTALEKKADDPAILLAIAQLVKMKDELIPSIEAYRQAKKAKATGAEEELSALEGKALLDTKPVSGADVNRIYSEVDKRLRRAFTERLKQEPNLQGGSLKIRVSVAGDGSVTAVEILEDLLKDDVLVANAYYTLKDAVYPPAKRTPTFEFVLAPPEEKKADGKHKK